MRDRLHRTWRAVDLFDACFTENSASEAEDLLQQAEPEQRKSVSKAGNLAIPAVEFLLLSVASWPGSDCESVSRQIAFDARITN